jgi:2-oxoglutarate ferredoxin oxidoreductase subunit gamma
MVAVKGQGEEKAAAPVEVRFSGSGGQGILLAAAVVAEAATALGKHVVATQSYGPAARGGASKAEVIVSGQPIDSLEVESPAITLCLSQEAFNVYAADTRPGGLLVYDAGLVTPGASLCDRDLCAIPFTHETTARLKRAVVANIVAVGALIELSGLLPAEAVEAAVVARIPERFRQLNIEAYRLGRELAGMVGGGDRASWDRRSPLSARG